MTQQINLQAVAQTAIDSAQKAKSLMAYCDYIAHLISKELLPQDVRYMQLLEKVGRPLMDLSPEGSFQSTKKTVAVTDRFGKRYLITVEEVSE